MRAIASDPIEGLDDDLALQREFVADRSPAYARLIDVLRPMIPGQFADGLREAWAGRSFGFWPERPLMLLTSLRDDALREGAPHPLWASLGNPERDLDSITDAAVAAAIEPGRTHLWHSLANRHVQTNDPSRAVAWMWPAALAAEAEPGRELELFDFGASAGLNLVADRLPWVWTTAAGDPLVPERGTGRREPRRLRPSPARTCATPRTRAGSRP